MLSITAKANKKLRSERPACIEGDLPKAFYEQVKALGLAKKPKQ
jgi:hypothetical protein